MPGPRHGTPLLGAVRPAAAGPRGRACRAAGAFLAACAAAAYGLAFLLGPFQPGGAGLTRRPAVGAGAVAELDRARRCEAAVVAGEGCARGARGRGGRPVVLWHVSKAAGSSLCLTALRAGERVRTDADHPSYGRGGCGETYGASLDALCPSPLSRLPSLLSPLLRR